jgi:hypothetical protein
MCKKASWHDRCRWQNSSVLGHDSRHDGIGPTEWSQRAGARQIAQEVKQTGAATKRLRPQLKPGTRLIREWQGRTYEVVVLDDGFSWQDTQCNSLSAIARKITATAWSGPLFFGLKQTLSASRRSSPASLPDCGTMEGSDAAE